MTSLTATKSGASMARKIREALADILGERQYSPEEIEALRIKCQEVFDRLYREGVFPRVRQVLVTDHGLITVEYVESKEITSGVFQCHLKEIAPGAVHASGAVDYCCKVATCAVGVQHYGIDPAARCPGLIPQADETFRCALADQYHEDLAIGAGCCSPMFNQDRERVLLNRSLQDALVALDHALTGKSDTTSGLRTTTLSLAFLDHELYLSDGGYSRVVFSWDRRGLFLTSNSRREVEARWNQAEPQRRAVEDVVIRWMAMEKL